MTTKATHQGHCQVCGSFQRLPGGVLSNHGYTVPFGYFSGTCRGSGYKPFETHTDRVQKSIDDATGWAEALEESARNWRAATTTVAFSYYVPAKYASSGRGRTVIPGGTFWKTVAPEAISEDLRHWTDPDGKEHQTGYYNYGPNHGLADLVAQQNEKYARHYDQQAAQTRAYIATQKARLAGWKPQPLKEVTK